MCDAISDAILDAYLSVDPSAKVAAESATKSNLIFVFGEISSNAHVDIEKVVRETVRRIGYDSPDKGSYFTSEKIEVQLSFCFLFRFRLQHL